MTKDLLAKRHVVLTVTVLVSILFFWSGRPLAQLTEDEFTCQLHSSQILGKFVAKKAQCIRSCQQNAYAQGDPPVDCVPPYAGNTFGCVNSTEAKTGGDGKRKCALDCPECYSAGDCNADIDAKVANREGQVEALAADVYCDDSASGDGLTLSEHKCQNTVIKFISFFHAKKVKCLARCHKAEHKGKIAAGSCTPGAITDLKTQECIDKLELKVATKIDLKCEAAINPSADKPDCGLYPARAGADWVAAEEAVVDANDPANFCAS